MDNEVMDNGKKKKKAKKNGKKKNKHKGDYDPHEVIVHFQNDLSHDDHRFGHEAPAHHSPVSHYLQ